MYSLNLFATATFKIFIIILKTGGRWLIARTFALIFNQEACVISRLLMKVFSKLVLFYPRIIPVSLLLVLARKTLNQTLRQVKKVNVAATVDKHQQVKFSLLYNKSYAGQSGWQWFLFSISCREIKSWNGTGQVYTYIGKINTINDWFSEKLNKLFHLSVPYTDIHVIYDEILFRNFLVPQNWFL